MLNPWRLQLLVQFASLGTMKQVSETMFISTAAVSQQLRQLEQDTGLILFEKVGRNIRLTAAGEELVQKVRPIINQLKIVESSLTDSEGTVRGLVRVGAFTSSLQRFVIPALEILHKRYPELNVKTIEMEPDESIPALDAFQLDLAIGYDWEEPQITLRQNLRNMVQLGTDSLVVIMNKNNPLASKKQITIKDLENQQWVLEHTSSYLAQYTRQLCHNEGYEPDVIHTVSSYLITHYVVEKGLAVSILPKLAVIPSLDGICYRELYPRVLRNIYLVSRKAQDASRADQAVSECIWESARSCPDLEMNVMPADSE